VPARVSKKESHWALRWAIIIVGLSCLPYLLAWWLAPADTQYTGLLINHYDGASYYAKMQQGFRGDWLFHLAFTPEPHDGTFIFVFYLALGHVARWTHLPIPIVYHTARAAAGLFLLLVAHRFITHFFERVQVRRATFLLLGFSAGLGWLLAPFGIITADLWIAEGFTFLSIFTNPHFPLAIGLMLLIFLSVLEAKPLPPLSAPRLLGVAGLSLLLALVQPFAVPIVLVVLAVYLAILILRDRRLPWHKILVTGAVALAAAPIMFYDLYVYQANSMLAVWSAQNQTPSLPPWNYALGYGLILLLAVGGIMITLRRWTRSDLFLLSWLGTAVVLLYVPFALQRRFITGLHVPLTLLAAIGLEQIVWPRVRVRRRSLVTGLIVGLTALTNLFVPLVSVIGVSQGQQPLVMTADEAAAVGWLGEHTTWTDTVLAPTESGQFIPAWAGNRVVYGHPFETVDAETKEAEVTHFYSAEATSSERRALLDRYDVRYVLVTSQEIDLAPASLGLVPVWTGGKAIVYKVTANP
jgi:hypothetical protein